MTSVSFTEQDLADFSEASGNRNPVHLSVEYARRTPYGQPIVFGCLGLMACLGHIRLPAGWCAVSLDADFLRPMISGVTYYVKTTNEGRQWRARLFDGSTPVLSVKVKAEPCNRDGGLKEIAVPSVPERSDAARRQQGEIVPGLKISGTYRCDTGALAAVAARWGVSDRVLGTLLSWIEFVVEMELPGESALLSRFVLHLPGDVQWSAVMTYNASVTSIDSRFGQVEMDVSLLAGASTVASGQCWSYMRPPVPEAEEIDSAGVKADSLAGRSAVIVGSSRGLGAALRRALELRGAVVYGIARSADAGDLARTEVGDAADAADLRRLRARLLRDRGRLDFLICNACPPILPLRLEPNAVGRIGAYINSAVSLTLAPLAEFLELLNRSDGCAVIVSSAAVEHPVREWPHYIAAKNAVEMLARVASLQYRRVSTLIVRPQKLLTAMTNTPLGRLDAVSPGLVANRIAARLEHPLDPGHTEILD